MDAFKNEIDFVFRDFIQNAEEREILKQSYQIRKLRKGEILFEKGDPWYKFAIILKGSMYSYYYDDRGEKCIVEFYYFPQNYYVVDYETFVKETEIALWYECFDDAVVLEFDGLKFYECYDAIPGIHTYRLKLAEDRYFKSLNVNKLMQSPNAAEKVQELYNQSPEIFKQFPYNYIASYLGMHRNTYRKAIRELNT